MDVGYALQHGVRQEPVDELHHRRGLDLRGQHRVVLVFLGLDDLDVVLPPLLEEVGHLGVLDHPSVVLLEVLAEGVLPDDDRLDLELGDELEVVDGGEVRRVRHRHRQHAPDPPEREDEMLVGDVRRNQLQDLRVDGDLRQVDGGHAVLLGEHPRELVLGHEAEADERVADARSRRPRLLQTLPELLLGDEALFDEEVPETELLGDRYCHRLRSPVRRNGRSGGTPGSDSTIWTPATELQANFERRRRRR